MGTDLCAGLLAAVVARVSGQLIELTSVGLAIKRFPVADPGAIAGGAGAIWLAHFNSGEVSRIDPQTGRATARIRLRLPKPITPGADRHFIGSAISVSGDRVWVSTARGWTAEIDPHTVGLVRMAYSSSEATSASTAGGVTWVADELAGVGTFTAASTRVTSRKITWAGQPLSIDTVDHGAGLIWTMGSGNLLTAGHQAVTIVTTIDPYTRQIEHQWQVPDTAAMVVSGDSAYVGDGKGGQIVRLTPPDHVQILHGPNAASLEAVTPHELWATTPTGELLRIALAPGGA